MWIIFHKNSVIISVMTLRHLYPNCNRQLRTKTMHSKSNRKMVKQKHKNKANHSISDATPSLHKYTYPHAQTQTHAHKTKWYAENGKIAAALDLACIFWQLDLLPTKVKAVSSAMRIYATESWIDSPCLLLAFWHFARHAVPLHPASSAIIKNH